MTTIETSAVIEAGAVMSGVTETSIVLEGVSWQTYERLLAGLGDRRVFVSYDRGLMEIQTMSPSYKHEMDGRILERLVGIITLLQDIPMQSGGSVTMRREDLEKGLEPDGCFWIANADKLRGVSELDLTKHPAPDLVIEVDIHASSVDRIEAYRRLGVREVWWNREDKGLTLLALQSTGEYAEVTQSANLPILDREVLAELLAQRHGQDETSRVNGVLKQLGLR